MAKQSSDKTRRQVVDSNDVTCSTCQAKLKGWVNIRDHTRTVHGREPYFNREGRYPNRVTMQAAYAGAFPELTICA